MNKLIFDSSALLSYLADLPGGEAVEDWLNRLVGQTEMKGWVSALAAGEVYHMVMRRKNEQTALRALRALTSLPVQIVPADLDLSIEAAKLKAAYAISYVDAFSAALTIREKGILLATDPIFNELKGVEFFEVQYL